MCRGVGQCSSMDGFLLALIAAAFSRQWNQVLNYGDEYPWRQKPEAHPAFELCRKDLLFYHCQHAYWMK